MAEPATQPLLLLAVEHHRAGRLPEAETLYRQVLAHDRQNANAYHLLGVLAQQSGRHDEAVALIHQALELMPKNQAILNNLANALSSQGRLDGAIKCYREAIVHKPDYFEGHLNLGNTLLECGQIKEAFEVMQRAITLNPNSAEAYNSLGQIYGARVQYDDALICFRQATVLKPDYADACNNLGTVLNSCGLVEESYPCFRRALALQPHAAAIHSNLILGLHFRFGHETSVIEAELQAWNRQHVQPLRASRCPHLNDRSPDRPLRIGYLSPDLGFHPVAFFLFPLLQAHDRSGFHITCYAISSQADEVTAQLRAAVKEWREVARLSAAEIADRIQADGIDILVDLSGHTAKNRLLVFARKPAPVQVGYLGFPGKTGLETIDARLGDHLADPVTASESRGPERLLRLRESAWCFAPLSGTPPVHELPALQSGQITFGCFNSIAKIGPSQIHLWSRVLAATPGSRLMLKNSALSTPSVIQRLQTVFAESGISTDRLDLVATTRTSLEHLECYNRVDIALDTFPYNGTTTTCEALWMGVPVVTLAGETHVTRVGLSLLTNVGLSDLVAHDPGTYVEIATNVARDLPRLAVLRSGLRDRMKKSPLMDAPRLAQNIESAYRALWSEWCARSDRPL